jgi:hypothetical protein
MLIVGRGEENFRVSPRVFVRGGSEGCVEISSRQAFQLSSIGSSRRGRCQVLY